MKKCILTLATLIALGSALEAAVIYSDNFERADSSATWGTATVGGAWAYQSATQAGLATGAPSFNGDGTDTNDFNVTSGIGEFEAGSVAPYSAGIFFATQSFSALTLGGAGKTATWGFNGRYFRNYVPITWSEASVKRGGFGMILAATSADLTDAGTQGYALVSRMTNPTMNSANTAVLQLIRFSGVFGDQTNWTVLAETDTTVFNSSAIQYITAKVDFDGDTNTWSLLASGSSTAFTDPLALTGTPITAVDSTYTGVNMVASGIGLYNSGSPLNDYNFDNLSFSTTGGGGSEPIVPVGVDVAVVGADVQCTFDSVNGQSYQLLVSTDDMASFAPVAGASDTGDGNPLTLTDTGGAPASGSKVFYKVETN